MRRTLVIALTWFLSFCCSCALSFAAGESTADTSVPWEIIAPDTAAGKPATDSRTIDTVPAVPLRQLSRRDSLLGSILSTLNGAHPIAAESVSVATVPGVQKRLRDVLLYRVREAASRLVRQIRLHLPIAVAVSAACGLILACWITVNRRRAKKDAKRFMTTTRLSLMDGEVQRACLHIEKKYMDPSLTPASVCGSIVTGQPFLETMFERELGMSIADYIDQVRIHRAQQIVQWNPVAEATFIAEHTGYPDAAEFVKQWNRVSGGDFYAYRSEKQHPSGGSA